MSANYRRDGVAVWAFVCSLVWAWSLTGCGGLVGNPNPPKDTGDEKSAIYISLTDAPIDEAQQLYINIIGFALWHDETESWIDVQLSVEKSIDVLELQGGKTIPLGFHGDLASGRYSRMRLELDPDHAPMIVYKDGREETLVVVGEAFTTEHPIQLTIADGEDHHYTLDFDVRRSVIPADRSSASAETLALMAEASDVLMEPTLRFVNDMDVGEINGKGEVGDVVCVYEIDAAKDEDSYCQGSVNSAVVAADGTFKVPFLPQGSYAVRHFKMGAFEDKDDVEVAPAKAKEQSADAQYGGRKPKKDVEKVPLSRPESRRPDAMVTDTAEVIAIDDITDVVAIEPKWKGKKWRGKSCKKLKNKKKRRKCKKLRRAARKARQGLRDDPAEPEASNLETFPVSTVDSEVEPG